MSESPISRLPKLSVVIPAYNEETLLPFTLQSVNDQDYLGEYEVIVVDNASTDSTPSIARKLDTKVIYEPKQGVVFARIRGFAEASGDIIVSTDADTIVPRDWLSLIEIEFRKKKYSGVVGAYTLNNLNTYQKKIMQSLIPVFRTFDRIFGGHFPGANFAVLKKAYLEVGGFDPRFTSGEDFELSNKLRQRGYKLRIAYHIRVQTSPRRINMGFWKTLFEYCIKNYGSLVLLNKPYLKSLPVVREKPEEIKEIVNHQERLDSLTVMREKPEEIKEIVNI